MVATLTCMTAVAMMHLSDVRPAIRTVAGKDVAVEFAKQEAEMKRLHIEAWEKSPRGKKGSAGGMGLSSLFGKLGVHKTHASDAKPC